MGRATRAEEAATELAARGLRATRQRIGLLLLLRRSRSHPTAAELHRSLLTEQPNLSLKTVYETLDSLVASGLAACVTDGGEPYRYEAHCHPHAANTHPESYPKFQTQLKKVALLRDMVNWCIENPLEGKPLAADDPRMLALESYILAQRAGTPLAAGKH